MLHQATIIKEIKHEESTFFVRKHLDTDGSERLVCYEPDISAYPFCHPHSATELRSSFFNMPLLVGHVGTVASRALPEKLKALPFNCERKKRMTAYYKNLYNLCYTLILKAFPDAKHGDKSKGEIILWRKQ